MLFIAAKRQFKNLRATFNQMLSSIKFISWLATCKVAPCAVDARRG